MVPVMVEAVVIVASVRSVRSGRSVENRREEWDAVERVLTGFVRA